MPTRGQGGDSAARRKSLKGIRGVVERGLLPEERVNAGGRSQCVCPY